MALAFASSAVVSVIYSDNELPVVQRHLRFHCAAPKDANGTGQHFSARSPLGQAVLDGLNSGLNSGLPMANGICKESNTIPTSIGRKILQNFPRGFSKIQWISLKKETQFRDLLGHQRQGFPNFGNYNIAKFEASGLHAFALFGFQIAATSNMLAVANRTLALVEPSVLSETLPSFQNVCVSSTKDTEAATPPLSSPHMGGGIKNKPPALEAWLNDIDSSVILPGPFRSQQVARERRKTTEIFGSVDQLSRNFEELRFKESSNRHPKFETLGTGFQHSSHGTGRNCNKSSGGGKNTDRVVDPERDPSKGGKKRPRGNDSDDLGGNSGGDRPQKKPGSGSGERSGARILCAYYENEPDLKLKEKHDCRERLFASHGEMCKHLRGVHIKPYQCPRCFSRYGRQNECKRHTDKEICYPHETVQDYVQEFNTKVMSSTESNLREILYANGEKQYDLADQTDKLKSNPRLSQNTVSTDRTIEDELLEELMAPTGAGGPPLHGSPATSPRNSKASIPRDRDELLACFDREFKLAEENGEAAVKLFLSQFISMLPTTRRMVLRYMLDEMASDGLSSNVEGTPYGRLAVNEVDKSREFQRGSMHIYASSNQELEDNQQGPNEVISVQYTSGTTGNYGLNVESRHENDTASSVPTGFASDSGCGPSVSRSGAGGGFSHGFNNPPMNFDNEEIDWFTEMLPNHHG